MPNIQQQFIKNEPDHDMSFESFWDIWDNLMNRDMFIQANIFLLQRYNRRWNEGK